MRITIEPDPEGALIYGLTDQPILLTPDDADAAVKLLSRFIARRLIGDRSQLRNSRII